MAELIGAIILPKVLPKVLCVTWNTLKSAYDVYSSIEIRKTQIRILLDRCRYLAEKLTQHLSVESNEALSPALQTGVDDLEETCQAVKDVLEKLEKKGFLWCMMNKDNIDSQILDIESQMTITFEVFNFIAHTDADRFQQDMRLAHEQDHTELVAKLDQLSASDQRILDALQDHGGLQRRMEELLVAVHKCVRRLGSEQSAEAKFLRNAGTALQRMSQGHSQAISEDWIVTSLEVDFDTANVIGQGSFGRVFRGQWNAALVAIKQMYINDARALTEKDRLAMYKEVKIWTTLHHPNIVNLYGACLEAEMPFLVMQHCRFGNLCQYLRANPDVNRIDLAYGVVAGMTYLHSRDIVHADLKGANVLVDDNHNALVADFGLSQAIDGMRSRSGHSTKVDGARGTLRWMAPECLDGNPETTASDVYSLGLTIWEIFSDEVPFSNISDRILPHYVIDRKQRPVRPSRLGLELQSSDAIWNLVQSCWAHEPDSRPSMSTLQRSLARYTSKLDSGKQDASPPTGNRTPDNLFDSPAPISTPSTLESHQSKVAVNPIDSTGSTIAPSSEQETLVSSLQPDPNSPKDKHQLLLRQKSHAYNLKDSDWRKHENEYLTAWRNNEHAYLTGTVSKDWSVVSQICECASSSKENAQKAVRTLRKELKYGDYTAQLSATHLWAILLQNTSEIFITECESKKFLDVVENLLKKRRPFCKVTSLVVQERLIHVLAAAAYASGSGNALKSLWKRVKPLDKPDKGVPFDTEDPMIKRPLS